MARITHVDRTGEKKEFEIRESYEVVTQCINAPARFVYFHLLDDTPIMFNKHFITIIEGNRERYGSNH